MTKILNSPRQNSVRVNAIRSNSRVTPSAWVSRAALQPPCFGNPCLKELVLATPAWDRAVLACQPLPSPHRQLAHDHPAGDLRPAPLMNSSVRALRPDVLAQHAQRHLPSADSRPRATLLRAEPVGRLARIAAARGDYPVVRQATGAHRNVRCRNSGEPTSST